MFRWSWVLALAWAGAVSAGDAPPRVVGPAETVFSWERDRCGLWDIPDAPARAWRGADGAVSLIAGAERNLIARGAALGAVRRDCAAVYQAGGQDDPAAYDDRGWIAATYVHADGRVEALVHEEYHGDKRPERCAGDYMACWRNAIVGLAWDGAGFRREGLVAALPYVYDGEAGRRTGYFNPSNIFRVGDYVYVFVFAEASGAQKRGACLLRRPVEGGPEDWRAWGGTAFDARFVDPYREDVIDPARHVCAPVDEPGAVISSVARRDGVYLALTSMVAEGRPGIYAMTSRDLLHWEGLDLVWEAPLLWHRDCASDFAYAYPSALDADSPSPNFDEVGERFWLYLTRLRLSEDCGVGPERDLVRLPVSWPRAGAGSEDAPAGPTGR